MLVEKYKLHLKGINKRQLDDVSKIIKKMYRVEKSDLYSLSRILLTKEKTETLKKKKTKKTKKEEKEGLSKERIKEILSSRVKFKWVVARRKKKTGKQFLRLTTLLRSPFVFKSSREQFKQTIYTGNLSVELCGLKWDPFIRGDGGYGKKLGKENVLLENLNYDNFILKNIKKKRRVSLKYKIQYMNLEGKNGKSKENIIRKVSLRLKKHSIWLNSSILSKKEMYVGIGRKRVVRKSRNFQRYRQKWESGSLGKILKSLPNGVELKIEKRQNDYLKSIIN